MSPIEVLNVVLTNKGPSSPDPSSWYSYKTTPFPFQKPIIENSWDRPYVSLFNDMGTGKTKIIIDQASMLYADGKIDALMVVAPNGVHTNWQSDEIPLHMPDDIREKARIFVYHSSKAKTKKAQLQRDLLLSHKGFAILLVSYEATITTAFKAFAKKFLTKRRAMLALDESHRIKSASSKVKMTVVAMGAYAPYRRIMTGTPVEVPPDIYSQIRFLSPDFWKRKGLPTKTEFDNYFCIFQDRQFGGRQFKQVVGYRNLETLAKWVGETGYRVTMEMAGIHLPPITYTKRYHEMFPEQRRMYDELCWEFRTEFADGKLVEAEAAITRLLRLQQVICGYLGTGPGEHIRPIDPKKNPRLEVAVDDILLDLPHQALVWCRFTEDVYQLMRALGKKAARYDGQVDADGRALAKAAFQKGDIQFMVLTDAGAEGLTLVGAKTALFYSNDFKMIKRLQKEKRNHRIGQQDPVTIVDLQCENTVDGQIIDALRSKFDLASIVNGDTLRDWI